MKKPNIIWLVVDGIRNYRTGVDEFGKLDFMEEFEEEAVYFPNTVTSAPSTVMSVSAMMTGMPFLRMVFIANSVHLIRCLSHWLQPQFQFVMAITG